MVARVIYELAGVAPAELGPCGSREARPPDQIFAQPLGLTG